MRGRRILHGHTANGRSTRTYEIWCNMLARCTNPLSTGYRLYGGRGVRVCERWRKFGLFLADMGTAPAGMTIDRIDSAGHYEASNCRWATWKQQGRNTSRNHNLTYKGVTAPISEWAEAFGLSRTVLRQRIYAHDWSIETALHAPVKQQKARYVKYKGVIALPSEWSRAFGLRRGVLENRLKMGWPMERALNQPSRRWV